MSERQLQLILSVQDRATRTLRRIGTTGQRAMRKISDGAARAGRAIKNAMRIGTTAVIAFGTAAAGAAIKFSFDFDRGIREVNTLLGLNAEGFAALKAEALDFASAAGVIPSELLPALYGALSAGVPRENVFTFLEQANMLAIAGVADIGSAVGVLSAVTNAYGSDVISAARVSDVLFTSVRLGVTTVSDLSANIATAVPIAASFGIEFEAVAAAWTTLTTQGVPTAQAMTQVRELMLALSAPSADVTKALAEQGIELSAARLAGEGFVPILNEIFAAAGGSESELKRLLGSTEALNAALVLGSEGGGAAYLEILDEMLGSTGATSDAFDIMKESAAQLWKDLKAQVSVVLIELGDEILPDLNTQVSKFAAFIRDNRSLIVDTFKLWAGRARDFAVNFARGVDLIFSNKAGIIAALTAIGVAVAFALGPVGIASVAIIGAIALIGRYRDNWFELKADALEALAGLLDGLLSFVPTALKIILSLPFILQAELPLLLARVGLTAAEALGNAVLDGLRGFEIPRVDFTIPLPGALGGDRHIGFGPLRLFEGVGSIDLSGLRDTLAQKQSQAATTRGNVTDRVGAFATDATNSLRDYVSDQFAPLIADARAEAQARSDQLIGEVDPALDQFTDSLLFASDELNRAAAMLEPDSGLVPALADAVGDGLAACDLALSPEAVQDLSATVLARQIARQRDLADEGDIPRRVGLQEAGDRDAATLRLLHEIQSRVGLPDENEDGERMSANTAAVDRLAAVLEQILDSGGVGGAEGAALLARGLVAGGVS